MEIFRKYCICTNFHVELFFAYFALKKIGLVQKLVHCENLVELTLVIMCEKNVVNPTIGSRAICIFLERTLEQLKTVVPKDILYSIQ